MSRRHTLKALVILLAAFGAMYALVAPVSTQGPGNAPGLQIGVHEGCQVAAGEVLVKFRDDARFAGLGEDLDADRDELVADGSWRRVHSRSHNVEALLARLEARADVEYVEPNYIVYALETPNDPSFGSLWGLLNTGQAIQGVTGTAGADISATWAWAKTTGSKANVVAVVDTGLDYTHPDLAGNVWSAPGSFTVTVGGVTVSCAAGTHGFNAITKTCNPLDDNGHGTHVSGTIGAVGNNGVGVAGVNWTASIMGLKFLNSRGSGTTADAINAIEFAIQAKKVLTSQANVQVLSNSWGGGGYSSSLFAEIQKANDNGMLFPVAAGNNKSNNDTTAYYPANYDVPNVVAVAATDNRDLLASFSNYGLTTVDLGAPGVNILSTYPSNRYAWMSGTSMATPHVAGAAALVLSACGALAPSSLKDVLLANTDRVNSLVGKTVTGGRLNAYTAVTNCGGTPPEPPPPAPPDFSISPTPAAQSVSRGTSAVYEVTIAPVNGSFTGDVSFSATGLPAGSTATFFPATVTGPGFTTMTIPTSRTTKTKTYNITITGTSGELVHSTTVKLTVTR